MVGTLSFIEGGHKIQECAALGLGNQLEIKKEKLHMVLTTTIGVSFGEKDIATLCSGKKKQTA